MIGLDESKKRQVSEYQPDKDVTLLTKDIRKDYGVGYEIQNHQYREFNDMSMLDRMNLDQKAFNTHVPAKSNDPDLSWRSNAVRPVRRNKVISIAAHATASFLYPNIFAQNDSDEVDRKAGMYMHNIIEANVLNSDYELNLLNSVIGSLVNPVSHMDLDFTERLQDVKVQEGDGYVSEQVIDEFFSGFQFNTITPEEMFIANAYESNHQKQRFVIKRRFIDIQEAEGLYEDKENFKFVKPGVRVFYNDDDGMFYEQYDEENPTLIEEVVYYNRREDMEVPFLNGIYQGEANTKGNAIRHRRIAHQSHSKEPIMVPVYAQAKFGYEPFGDGHFYYYKSLVNKMWKDGDLLDEMWRRVMDGTFLDVMPPVGISGEDIIDRSVMVPASVTSLSEETRITPLRTGGNLNSGYNSLQELERNIASSSQDSIREGQQTQGSQTAFEIARIEQNARINFKVYGQQLGNFVKQVGYLMIDNILVHQTVGEVEEMFGGLPKMKFRSFVIPDKTEDGKKQTIKIRFTDAYSGMKMSKEDIKRRAFKLWREKGGDESDTRLIEINPGLFRKMRWLLTVNPDTMVPKNEAFDRAFKLEFYDRAIANPFIDAKAVTQDFLVEPYAEGESEKYMKKMEELVGAPQQAPQGQPQRPGTGQTSELVEQVTGSKELSSLLAS